MFSGHLKKIDEIPYKALFGVAAGLVFLCQLVAMALVVDGQVQRAEVRDAQYSSAQGAIADCVASQSGTALGKCIQQPKSASKGLAKADSIGTRPVAAAYAPDPENPALSSHPVEGFRPASFVTR